MKHLVFTLLFICYPLVVYFGLQWVEPKLMAAILAGLVVIRYWGTKTSATIPNIKLIGVALITLFVVAALTNSSLSLKFYPVVINLGFLAIFWYSLYSRPAIITRIASIREELTEEKIKYTEAVTRLWCGFFVLNSSIALLTIFLGSDEIWLLYNGMLSYIMMGTLFAAEWIYRRKIKKYG